MVEMKEIIKNATKYYIMKENGLLGKEMEDKMLFIESSIKALRGDNKQIMTAYFCDGISATIIADNVHLSRQAVYKRIDKLARDFENIYHEKIHDYTKVDKNINVG